MEFAEAKFLKPTLVGPQGKSEDQPHAKQIAPAEGVTPPAEVHACPTVHSAPWHDPLPLAYRGDRLAFRAPHRQALARFESRRSMSA
jgi:hypothetical protein